MAIIRASCPDCGDVELTSRDVTVRVNSGTNEGSYAFQCPECQLAVSKAAEARIIDLLVSSGVELYVWSMPAELLEERIGEPISYDDLLEFHYDLQANDWFDKVTATAKDRDVVMGRRTAMTLVIVGALLGALGAAGVKVRAPKPAVVPVPVLTPEAPRTRR